MNLFYEIIEKKDKKNSVELTKTEMIIQEYIKNNIGEIQDITITKLAEDTYTSRATIDRYIKKYNEQGYKDFKSKLLNDKKNYDTNSYNKYQMNELKDSFDRNQIKKFTNQIFENKNESFLVIGMGGSYISAQYLSRRLKNLHFKINAATLSEVLGQYLDVDNIILISNSGKTPIILNIISDYPKIKFWAITQRNSELAKKIVNKVEIEHKIDLSDMLERDNQMKNIQIIEMIFNLIKNK